MLIGSTLVVVADGAVARFLSRARPGARLVELADKRMQIGPVESERDRPSRTNDSFGPGRHKIEKRLTAHEAAEEVFLSETASRVLQLLRAEQIAHLVLCAPPRALGSLRKALPAEAREQVTLSLDKDVTKETPAKIDERLRDQGV